MACNIQAVSEAFMLAKKAGVDPENVFEAIKDLNNAIECAHSVGAPVPMTAQVSEIMQYLHNNGDGNSDHSAIIHYYEKLTGTKL